MCNEARQTNNYKLKFFIMNTKEKNPLVKFVNQANATRKANNTILSLFNELKKETKDINGNVVNKELTTLLKSLEFTNTEFEGKTVKGCAIQLLPLTSFEEVLVASSKKCQFTPKTVAQSSFKFSTLASIEKESLTQKSEVLNTILKEFYNEKELHNNFLKLLGFYNIESDKLPKISLSSAKIILEYAPSVFVTNNLIELFKDKDGILSCVELFNKYLQAKYEISDVYFYKVVSNFNACTLTFAIKQENEANKQRETLQSEISRLESLGYKVELSEKMPA